MSLEKKQLLSCWMKLHLEKFSCSFCLKDEPINSNLIQNNIKKMILGYEGAEYIYLLCINVEQDIIPIYIGKSITPVTRWRSHIKNLQVGNNSYGEWRNKLFDNQSMKYDCILMVVPDIFILEPPIIGFPKTIGSVEYQLIGLTSDAYPDTLLNNEGNRR
jgi:hypothetical protein